jgi:hypothetical protein
VDHRQFENCAVCSPTTLVIGAATEPADQEANAERNGGGRIGALLYRCAQEIAGFAGPFSDSFSGISRSLLSLAVTACSVPSICLALPWSSVFTSRQYFWRCR